MTSYFFFCLTNNIKPDIQRIKKAYAANLRCWNQQFCLKMT